MNMDVLESSPFISHLSVDIQRLRIPTVSNLKSPAFSISVLNVLEAGGSGEVEGRRAKWPGRGF